jgi:hypothetical protein
MKIKGEPGEGEFQQDGTENPASYQPSFAYSTEVVGPPFAQHHYAPPPAAKNKQIVTFPPARGNENEMIKGSSGACRVFVQMKVGDRSHNKVAICAQGWE